MFKSLGLNLFKNEAAGPYSMCYTKDTVWSAIPKILFPERWVVQYFWCDREIGVGSSIVSNLVINPLDQSFPAGIERHKKS